MKKNNKVVDTRHAKSGQYGRVLQKIAKKGKCPFCPAQLRKNQKPIIEIKRVGNWFLTPNNYSYQNARIKLMIIGDRHSQNFSELTAKDFREVVQLVNWAIKKYDIQGGGLAIRFGETKFTGATVCHLHFHLISPTLKTKGKNQGFSKPVWFPIG